ncbi:MAG: flavodoxin family protein [Leptolyngbya sp. LCM1.Bin17]|nr:MAG: flavodoxin family protein [Leptolyngbya sp. LCM1.Bin17]
MNTPAKVVGIVGSYRKQGTIDQMVSAVLQAAAARGADTEKIYLLDQHIEFCTNCRHCLQQPGPERGACIWQDDMDALLDRLEAADALVLGAPVNCGSVNALTQRFIERTVVYGYWPWGTPAPQFRQTQLSRKAVLISASAAPGLIGRWVFGSLGSLKGLARRLGAKPVGTLWAGMVNTQGQQIGDRTRCRAQQLAKQLT